MNSLIYDYEVKSPCNNASGYADDLTIHGLTEIFIHCHLKGFSVRKVFEISWNEFGVDFES